MQNPADIRGHQGKMRSGLEKPKLSNPLGGGKKGAVGGKGKKGSSAYNRYRKRLRRDIVKDMW